MVNSKGSGKGTQASKIQRDFGAIPISTGQILRNEVSSKSQLGKQAEKQMNAGGSFKQYDLHPLGLVEDSIMYKVIENQFNGETIRKQGWILDGFPRTVPQANQLDLVLSKLNQPLDYVLYLDVAEDIVYERIKDRLVHPGSGRVYNIAFNPPKVPGKDDITGEPLIKREDDDKETIRSRLLQYHNSTAPVLDYYKNAKKLVSIPSPTSDIGYVSIKDLLSKLVSK